ncbi:alkaline phosphatase family protein [candidate division KSB1 bacterium]|nr:alkaline phosphatase family protein [candidate division KSB1 bacterium]
MAVKRYYFLSLIAAFMCLIWACKSMKPPQRVIVLSLRGLSDQDLDERLARGEASAFQTMANEGYRAIHLNPIPCAETAPAMATFETGAYPSSHGIVGNRFRRKGASFDSVDFGYNSNFACEAVWEAAERQGKKVIRLGSLFLHGVRHSHNSVKTLAQANALGASKHVILTAHQSRWNLSNGRYEHVKALIENPASRDRLEIEISGDEDRSRRLHALAVDTLVDDTESYQALIVDDDTNLGNGFLAELTENQWAQLALAKDSVAAIGSFAKLLAFDSHLKDVELYVKGPQQNRGYPHAFIANLENVIGLAPGGPDFDGYHNGQLDEKTIIEQIERELDYLTAAANFCLENEDFDLLMIDYPVFDRFGHPFYLKDARQQNYGDEGGRKRTRFENYFNDAFERCDELLRLLLEKTDPATALIATSEYGFFVAHSRLALNKLLAEAGLRVGSDQTSQVIAVTSTVSANIYVNLAGREPNGAVLQQDYNDVVEKIISACHNYRNAATGEHVFDEVRRFSELPSLKLDHGHAGDVWVRLKPGYTFRGDIDPTKPLVDQPRFLGEHGYAPAAAQAKGIFFSFGPLPKYPASQEVDAVDVAVTVSALLGIVPPKGTHGRNIFERN